MLNVANHAIGARGNPNDETIELYCYGIVRTVKGKSEVCEQCEVCFMMYEHRIESRVVC